MTQLLEQAIAEAQKLAGPAQDAIAALILEQIADDRSREAADAELTPQQAADLLDVSGPFLLKLLESGALPSSNSGPDRRVPLTDLLRYKEALRRDRRAALDELVAEAQELGLGY